MEKLTDLQKKIYNCYLKHSRYGLPFNPRQNFESINEFTLLNLKKISSLFSKHKHLDMDTFFMAPLTVYKDMEYPKLDFFSSRSAIRAYSLYNKKKENENPENQFDSIKNSFHFILKFCIDNKIQLKDYLIHKNGLILSWMTHYRERKINIYSLMEIGDLVSLIDNQPKDIVDILTDSLSDKIHTFKIRYKNSQKTVDYVKKGTSLINNFLKKQLHSSK
jgi:hypothetical protein